VQSPAYELPPKREPLEAVPAAIIAANVEKAYKTLDEIEERNMVLYIKGVNKGKKKPLKDYEGSIKRQKEMLEIAKKVVSGKDAINKAIKDANREVTRLKLSHTEEALKDLRDAVEEYKTVVQKEIGGFSYILTQVNRKPKFNFKATMEFFEKLVQQVNYLAQLRDDYEQTIKRASRSDKQNSAADKASATMKARWGEF